jgi:hypothetical protein
MPAWIMTGQEGRDMEFTLPLPEGDSSVILESQWELSCDRKVTTCVIHSPKRTVAGAAIKHPKDSVDKEIGFKLAFSRALEQLYPNVKVPEWDSVPELNYQVAVRDHNDCKENRSVAWEVFLKEMKQL